MRVVAQILNKGERPKVRKIVKVAVFGLMLRLYRIMLQFEHDSAFRKPVQFPVDAPY